MSDSKRKKSHFMERGNGGSSKPKGKKYKVFLPRWEHEKDNFDWRQQLHINEET